MTDSLPPLTALRAFEATARHLSVRRAAEQLNVTPSAISHQLRTLEDALQVRLFRRMNRRLVLTEAGQVLLPDLRDGFERLAAAVAALQRHRRRGVLTVSMLSTFAVRWFIPRLSRFRKAHADIEVHVSTTLDVADFERDGIDAAIRYGLGAWPGLQSDRLIGEEIVPVCAPGFPAEGPPLQTPHDLARHTLLLSEARPDDWAIWLESVDAPTPDPAHSIVFDLTHFALDAAVGGAGVAIVARALVEDDLASGRLVIPFDRPYRREAGYYLVCPMARAEEPKIAALRDWLLQEVNRR